MSAYVPMDPPLPNHERLARIEAIQAGMAQDINDMKREMHSFAENALPRHEANARIAETDRRLMEIQADVAARLESREYNIAHESIVQRVARLETNPQRLLGWISLCVSAGGCLVTFLGVVVAFISGFVVYLAQTMHH